MIKKYKLNNGLKVILEDMPESHSATVMVWIDAGPIHEPKELSGISHFIEHMLFKGTKSRSSKTLVQLIEDTGGCINAFTEKEFTCYYAKILSEKITVAIDVLLDMVLNSTNLKEHIEIERQVIIEEIKMYEDTPDELVHDVLIQTYWENHPLSRIITGTSDTVDSFTREDILNYITEHYTPDNIVISIAGKFNENEVIDCINKNVSHIKASGKKSEMAIPVFSPNFTVSKKDIEQTHLCIGMRGLSVMDERRYASSIIDICLGGGMTSRLFQEIRETKGLVYSINTFEALYRPLGIFGVYAATNHENSAEVIELIYSEIENFKTNGITTDEVERAILQLKGSMLIGLESTKFRASRNGRCELYFKKTIDIQELTNSIEKVTVDEINKLSEYIFDTDYFCTSIVSPKDFVPNIASLSC